MKTKYNKHFEQHTRQHWIMCYKRHTLHSQSQEAHRLENVFIIILPLSLGRHIVMWSYHIENISTLWTANANPWLLAQTNKCAAQWFYTSIYGDRSRWHAIHFLSCLGARKVASIWNLMIKSHQIYLKGVNQKQEHPCLGVVIPKFEETCMSVCLSVEAVLPFTFLPRK